MPRILEKNAAGLWSDAGNDIRDLLRHSVFVVFSLNDNSRTFNCRQPATEIHRRLKPFVTPDCLPGVEKIVSPVAVIARQTIPDIRLPVTYGHFLDTSEGQVIGIDVRRHGRQRALLPPHHRG